MKHLSLAFVVFILIVAIACKKEQDDTVPVVVVPEVLDFSFTGNLMAGNEITFTAEVHPAYKDEQIAWQIDDGYLRTYTGRIVKSTFSSKVGNRLVTMKVIREGKMDTIISKELYIKFDTTGMSGMRHWTGMQTGADSTNGIFSTTLDFYEEVKIINDSTVSFYIHDTLFVFSEAEKKRVMPFYIIVEKDSIGTIVGYKDYLNKYNAGQLSYYVKSDSFVYSYTSSNHFGITIFSSRK